jgi:Tfp pilus assembly PilM family ATPase
LAAVFDILTRSLPRTCVGLDVGQSALRAAQLRRLPGARRGWAVTVLAACHRRGPERGGDESKFVERAARWMNQLGLRRAGIVAGLSPPDVEIHPVDLSTDAGALDRANGPDVVRQELERLITFAADDVETDYWRLPSSPAGRTTAVGVAARSDAISQVLAICQAAGMDCRQIDATPCALARFGALYRGLPGDDEDVWSIVDLGGRMSRIIVCLGEAPILARAFIYGGRNWTDKLAQSLAVSPQTAERHKQDYGIVRSVPDGHGQAPAARTIATLGELIYNVLRTDLDEMCAELERSYRYVLQCFPGHAPGPVVLTGGGAGLCGLDGHLRRKLGVEVFVPGQTVPDASRLDCTSLRGDSSAAGSIAEYASAIGLAIPQDNGQ